MAALPLAAGCESMRYYAQAIGGHLSLMAAARPVEAWIADPQTPPELRDRLHSARRIREFASRHLALPENASYTAYADLGRAYALWNVFAAPQFSVEPKTQCFPFAGCVAYRGFYSEQAAQRHAQRLRAEGYDVHVGGVPAYSTLGWFDDPLLSTFIHYPEAQLASLVFHELAHQVAYAKDDTTFNESFAAVVEDAGVRRWLAHEGRDAELAAFLAARSRQREFAARVRETRERLAAVYRMDLAEDEMRGRKRAEYESLRAAYPGVVPAQANNAFLLSVALYIDLVPALERLLAESGSLEKFYERVKQLAAGERSARYYEGGISTILR